MHASSDDGGTFVIIIERNMRLFKRRRPGLGFDLRRMLLMRVLLRVLLPDDILSLLRVLLLLLLFVLKLVTVEVVENSWLSLS